MGRRLLGITAGAVANRILRYDFQFELFDRARLPRTMAERHHFVLKPEVSAALDRGEEIQLDELKNYTLCKRENEVKIFETAGGNYGGATYSHSGAVGLNAMTADEIKLFATGQLACSVEVGETFLSGSSFH